MPYLNKLVLMGHLTRDPELRFTQTGKGVANFSIATSSGSGEYKQTEFHRCTIWNSKIEWATQASKLHKGDLVYAEGQVQTREWEDQTGQKRQVTEVLLFRLDFLRSPLPKNETGDTFLDPLMDRAEQIIKASREVNPDDIPF